MDNSDLMDNWGSSFNPTSVSSQQHLQNLDTILSESKHAQSQIDLKQLPPITTRPNYMDFQQPFTARQTIYHDNFMLNSISPMATDRPKQSFFNQSNMKDRAKSRENQTFY